RALSAHTPLTHRAGVAVVAGRPIGLPPAAGAHPGLAAVARRAAVAVVARRAVRLAGVGAGAVAVAGARLVALVGRRAGEGRAAAGPRRAGAEERGGGDVVAGRAVRLDGVGAGAVAIAGAGLVALVGRRAGEGRAAAGPRRADVVLGARGAVVAGRSVRLVGVGAGAVAIAGAGLVALVGRRAGEGRAAAGPRRADVVLGARGAVVARRPVPLVGVGVGAVAVAGAGLVALVGRRAGEGRARADLGRADVGLRAEVAVVARRAVARRHPDAPRGRAAVVRRAGVAVVTGRT